MFSFTYLAIRSTELNVDQFLHKVHPEVLLTELLSRSDLLWMDLRSIAVYTVNNIYFSFPKVNFNNCIALLLHTPVLKQLNGGNPLLLMEPVGEAASWRQVASLRQNFFLSNARKGFKEKLTFMPCTSN